MGFCHLLKGTIQRIHNQLPSIVFSPSCKILKSSFSNSPRLPILTLYTKDPCPLCDDAKESLQPLKHLFTLEEVDITEPRNMKWFKMYCYDIPVFHFEGEFLMKHRVDLEALKSALKSYHNSSGV